MPSASSFYGGGYSDSLYFTGEIVYLVLQVFSAVLGEFVPFVWLGARVACSVRFPSSLERLRWLSYSRLSPGCIISALLG
jgi:hypothetical protein